MSLAQKIMAVVATIAAWLAWSVLLAMTFLLSLIAVALSDFHSQSKAVTAVLWLIGAIALLRALLRLKRLSDVEGSVYAPTIRDLLFALVVVSPTQLVMMLSIGGCFGLYCEGSPVLVSPDMGSVQFKAE
jgi:hypothetical protein